MRTTRLLPLAFLLASLAAPPLTAQTERAPRLSFSARAGAAFPFGDFADVAATGHTLSLDAGYAILPPLSVTAGYRYTQYPLAGPTLEEITLQGPALGVELYGPKPIPWLTAGIHAGVYLLDVSVEGASGAGDFDDPEVGYFGGVELGSRLGGGLTGSIFADIDICPPNWPRGPFPPRPKGFELGFELSLGV
ncbi:MAG TPA: hypothetical protein VFQ45_21405 [Longimicrobium sp.]|nr:hypothetical protein [Longimicrobium sp.]